MELIMLGTGNAMVTHCYNTCFALREGSEFFLVDAGGGNGILRQLEDAKLPISQVHHLFVTHPHTDHVLGVVWVVRAVCAAINKGQYKGNLTIWCHDELVALLEPLCQALLAKKLRVHIGPRVQFVTIHPGDHLQTLGMDLEVFDIASTKAKQYGFCATLPDGQKLTCLGDESFNPVTEAFVMDADWLLTEAFCLYADRDTFHPYEKHHSTVRDASEMAQAHHIKHLVLYHTEDKTLATRKMRYTEEALASFSGAVYVPDDLEIITL